MPFGEEYASTPIVSVAGTALPPELTGLLSTVDVDDSVHLPSMFVLEFADVHDVVLQRASLAIGTDVTVAVQTAGSGGPVALLEGVVTALEREITSRGVLTIVRGLDMRHRFQSGARTEAHHNVTVSDVVRQVAQRAGLASEVDAFAGVHKQITQDGISDWELLRRLADRVGAVVSVRGRTLHFRSGTRATTAPTSRDARSDAHVLEAGADLLSLRATATSSAQVPEVEVRGWDPQAKRAVVDVAPSESTVAAGSTTPKKLASAVGGTRSTHGVAGMATTDEVTREARVAAAHRAAGFVELDGTVRGNPELRAGDAVHLVGVGATWSGKYVLSAVRHEFSAQDGYLTSFTAAGGSDRSTFGVMTASTETQDARHHGVLAALVTNVKDPDNRGRVKVKLPTLSEDYESWWARPVQLGAGAKRGAVVLPEVNDEVLVAFGQGDVDEPYVLGGLYNGKDAPEVGWDKHVGSDGTVARRAFVSRTGMVVEMLEDGQTAALTVSTNAGDQHITLTQSASKGIEIVSEGPVSVTAKADVSVTAQQNVSLATQGGDITLEAMNINLKASAKVELAGTAVKVAGSGQTEVSSSGVTTVRGSMVQIN